LPVKAKHAPADYEYLPLSRYYIHFRCYRSKPFCHLPQILRISLRIRRDVGFPVNSRIWFANHRNSWKRNPTNHRKGKTFISNEGALKIVGHGYCLSIWAEL